ncbi:MAG: menaquinone-specific isochorismate synthase [Bacteriovoracaceae bacterium]|jgi:menaquinone-specific isochorismate synthase
MIEFYELKEQVITEVNRFLKELEHTDISFNTFETQISLSSIKELIPFLKDVTTCYFKTPTGSEILGMKELSFYNNDLELDEIEDLLSENPKLDFMGALPFTNSSPLNNEWEDFQNHFIFLPRIVIIKENKKTFLRINISKAESEEALLKMNLLTEIEDLFSFIHRNPNNLGSNENLDIQNQDHWTKLITDGLTELDQKTLKKVVLARSQSVTYEKEIDAHKLFCDFKSSANLYQFFYHSEHGASFISFTPEKLFSKHKDIVVVDSIAGTLKVDKDNKGADLLQSTKDLEEHRFVSNYIKEKLLDITEDVSELFKEEVLSLKNLYHIHSRFKAKLTKKISNRVLIDTLHPTPAVGGYPKEEALDFISRNENLQRGFYAAPIGRISSQYSEFAVGIRSMLVVDDTIHFYGGAGIVKGSMPAKEWTETSDKIRSVQCMM